MNMKTANGFPASLTLVGAGKMGGAMLERWLGDGLSGAVITVIDPNPSDEIAALCRAQNIRLNPASAALPDMLVLAVKPQMLDAIAPDVAAFIGPQTTLLSILAGKTVANLAARFPTARAIVRAMPNLPASIGQGATGVFSAQDAPSESRAAADAVLRSVGVVVWVDDESLLDAVTAISGSGPAYVFHLVECLTAAGIAAGLPENLSGTLARQTVIGGGALLAKSPLSAAVLRANVTSPGGTTAAALAVLMAQDGLPPVMTKAVLAAKRRAEELSG